VCSPYSKIFILTLALPTRDVWVSRVLSKRWNSMALTYACICSLLHGWVGNGDFTKISWRDSVGHFDLEWSSDSSQPSSIDTFDLGLNPYFSQQIRP